MAFQLFTKDSRIYQHSTLLTNYVIRPALYMLRFTNMSYLKLSLHEKLNLTLILDTKELKLI